MCVNTIEYLITPRQPTERIPRCAVGFSERTLMPLTLGTLVNVMIPLSINR